MSPETFRNPAQLNPREALYVAMVYDRALADESLAVAHEISGITVSTFDFDPEQLDEARRQLENVPEVRRPKLIHIETHLKNNDAIVLVKAETPTANREFALRMKPVREAAVAERMRRLKKK